MCEREAAWATVPILFRLGISYVLDVKLSSLSFIKIRQVSGYCENVESRCDSVTFMVFYFEVRVFICL